MCRGFGSLLVGWGMLVAKQDKLVVSVLASPMGKLLYSHLGFKNLGRCVVQALEETESVDCEFMVLEIEKARSVKHEI